MDMKSLGIQLASRFENTPKLVKRDDSGNGNADQHQVPCDKNLEKNIWNLKMWKLFSKCLERKAYAFYTCLYWCTTQQSFTVDNSAFSPVSGSLSGSYTLSVNSVPAPQCCEGLYGLSLNGHRMELMTQLPSQLKSFLESQACSLCLLCSLWNVYHIKCDFIFLFFFHFHICYIVSMFFACVWAHVCGGLCLQHMCKVMSVREVMSGILWQGLSVKERLSLKIWLILLASLLWESARLATNPPGIYVGSFTSVWQTP